MKSLISVFAIFLTVLTIQAQSEIELHPDGIVVPRTTTGAVSNPVEGMLIYDTSVNAFRYYDGSNWQSVGTGGAGGPGALGGAEGLILNDSNDAPNPPKLV